MGSMPTLWYTILANIIVSSGSLIGVLTLPVKLAKMNKIILLLVSLSAGTLMGSAFLHLLPESIETLGVAVPMQIALVSFVIFFLIEKTLHWHHHHHNHHDNPRHTLGYINLIGDGLHNFLDGLVIAAAFQSGVSLGFATTFAITMHELPQEIGDFGVLIHSGFKRSTAIIANVLVSLTAIAGGIVGYSMTTSVEGVASYLLPVAAGGFLYISASDLMPEIKIEKSARTSLRAISVFLLGVAIMYFLKD